MIVFYYGQDGYRVRSARDDAVRQFRAKHPERLSLTRCDCSDPGARELLEGACKTTSFFDDLHLVVLTNAFHTPTVATWVFETLSDAGTAEARDIVVLATALGSASSLSKEHVKLAKLLLAGSPAREFKPLTERTLPTWVVRECTARGGRIVPAAAATLVSAVGADTDLLAREIEKLCAFVGAREVTTADVALLVPAARREASAFALTDALAAGDGARASALLYQQLSAGDDPHRVLALIAWQLRTLLTVSDLVDRGMGSAEVARVGKLKPFVVTKALRAVRSRGGTQSLRTSYRALCELDTAAKSGSADLAGELFSFLLTGATV